MCRSIFSWHSKFVTNRTEPNQIHIPFQIIQMRGIICLLLLLVASSRFSFWSSSAIERALVNRKRHHTQTIWTIIIHKYEKYTFGQFDSCRTINATTAAQCVLAFRNTNQLKPFNRIFETTYFKRNENYTKQDWRQK